MNQKICTHCKISQNLENFSFKTKKLNLRYSHCKTCQKKFRRESYLRNREYYLNKDKTAIKERRLKRYNFIIQYKSNKPCKDCNVLYPHYVMDFDHLPEFKKEIPIASRGRLCSEGKLLKEFSKCELVCANCHRERTWKRQNGG